MMAATPQMLARMRADEARTLVPFADVPSNYAKVRRLYVDFLWDVKEAFQLQHSTIHLAVRLMDTFHVRSPLALAYFDMVALCCVAIAVKFEEVAALKLADLCKTCPGLAEETLRQMEVTILTRLNWNVHTLTVSNFMGVFFRLSCGDLAVDEIPRAQTFASFYADLAIQDTAIALSYAPSLVGISCVCAARQHLRLQPPALEQALLASGYSHEAVMACTDELLMCYERVVNERPGDMGTDTMSMAGTPNAATDVGAGSVTPAKTDQYDSCSPMEITGFMDA